MTDASRAETPAAGELILKKNKNGTNWQAAEIAFLPWNTRRCQIGATPKLSLEKAEVWKLRNRCGTATCGGGRTRARTWDPMIKSQRIYCYSAAKTFRPPCGPAAIRGQKSKNKFRINEIWRRACQSIPAERSSIFDLPGPKPTV